jgi:lipopolysaccharide export LptBFGC system permease protein LptF
MSTLDRYIFGAACSRWALVLVLGIFLAYLGDFIASMGDYLGAIAAHRGLLFLQYSIIRFPSVLVSWLPLSVAVAALLTVTPMIRQGTLVALSAGGLAPRRIFRSLLLLAG